jgi:chromosome segregation ATPase
MELVRSLDKRLTIKPIPVTMSAKQYSAPPFKTKFPAGPTLTLTRRAWREASASAGAAAGTGEAARSNTHISAEVERAARQMDLAIAERERKIAEAEASLADRARDLDELEALLRARESLIAATRLRDSKSRLEISPREAAALNQLKEELEKQEASLREGREALRERERYLEESENRLFAKVQEQQEKEMELEQREENLVARAIQGSPTDLDPVSTTETPARSYDEFRE